MLTLLACGLTQAQTIYLCKDGHYTTRSITEGLAVDLTQGYDSITFSRPQMSFDVTIAYAGNTATVSIPEELAEEVVCTSGTSSNVVITNSNTYCHQRRRKANRSICHNPALMRIAWIPY